MVYESPDRLFMMRALELAALGAGHVSPNPMVGSVIVHNDKIIGEGWHQKYGGPHAEVNAISSVADKNLLSESTIYVTLEPCSHHGKTPPCADLLIREKVKKVVVATVDPNPLVAGKGLEKLVASGIEISTGQCEQEASFLNRRFFTFMKRKRPYIILKWAETADGFIARTNGDSKWISDDFSRKLVHKWRTEEDAILVGSNTVQQDNPQLNVRDWTGKNPVRLIIDRTLKLNSNYNIFDQTQQTIVYNIVKDETDNNVVFKKLSTDRFLDDMMEDLFQRKIQSVIIEGGSAVHNLFMDNNLWDEARVFLSPLLFGNGIASQRLNILPERSEQLKTDSLKWYFNLQALQGS